jgi:hypothetical protein
MADAAAKSKRGAASVRLIGQAAIFVSRSAVPDFKPNLQVYVCASGGVKRDFLGGFLALTVSRLGKSRYNGERCQLVRDCVMARGR